MLVVDLPGFSITKKWQWIAREIEGKTLSVSNDLYVVRIPDIIWIRDLPLNGRHGDGSIFHKRFD